MLKINKNYLKETLKVNQTIFSKKLSKLNFGNASIVDRKESIIYIKGSGFELDNLNLKNISVCKFNKKNFIVEKNSIKPSVDVYTHIYIYNNLKHINSIVHTHSKFATILSQAEIEPECYGTTHADFFNDKIPLSKKITKIDKNNYELHLGKSIYDIIKNKSNSFPGILLINHGAYSWGKDSHQSLYNAEAIELISELYYFTRLVSKKPKISKNLINFHYNRKHGPKKYYGQ